MHMYTSHRIFLTGHRTTKTDQTQDEYEIVPLAYAAYCAVEREREQPRSRHERFFST